MQSSPTTPTLGRADSKGGCDIKDISIFSLRFPLMGGFRWHAKQPLAARLNDSTTHTRPADNIINNIIISCWAEATDSFAVNTAD